MYYDGQELNTNSEDDDNIFKGYGEGYYNNEDDEETDPLEINDPFAIDKPKTDYRKRDSITGRFLRNNPLNKTVLDSRELEELTTNDE